MARAHYWQYITNNEGQPLDEALISVYEAGGTTPAYVFSSEDGGVASNSTPQTTSDEDGFFEFWIGDNTETYGYPPGQKFKLSWSKTGVITPGEIDNIDISVETNKAGIYTETVEAASWTASGGVQYIDITHNLNRPYPLVICYDDAAQTSVAITAGYIGDNITRVWRTGALKSHITVIG
jgi:hypothetical protein